MVVTSNLWLFQVTSMKMKQFSVVSHAAMFQMLKNHKQPLVTILASIIMELFIHKTSCQTALG